MQIEITALDESYKGKQYLFRYESEFYFEITIHDRKDDFGIQFTKKAFGSAVGKQFESTLLEDWLENPMLFGAFYNGGMAGFIELSHEQWNNRLRISNILVEETYRNKGIGKQLMAKAELVAKQRQARALILETQSCNYPAISFYKANGYSIVGFDLCAYTNNDIEKCEVRIEMAKYI